MDYYAQKHHIAVEKLFVGDPAIIQYPVTNKKVWQAAVGERGTKINETVTIDLATQTVVDGAVLNQAEIEAHNAKYGKLEPALYEKLQVIAPTATLTISIWTTGIDIEQIRSQIAAKYPEAKLIGFLPSEETDLKLYDQIFAEMLAAEAKAYQEAAAPLIAFLEERGWHVTYVSQVAPIIFATLPKEMILEIAKRDDVVAFYLGKSVKLLLDSTTATDRVNTVWARSTTGSGIKVAVIEPNGIDFTHDYLADGQYAYPNTPNVTDHPTNVAGIIASTHSQYRGVAYGVPALYSGNVGATSLTNIINTTDLAIMAGASVLNLSWGTLNPANNIDDVAKYYDHVVRWDRLTVVAAGQDSPAFVFGSPANAYNVIGVGGLEDEGFSDGNWSNDSIWDDFFAGSAYQNPNDGREKPEVVAVAKDVVTTGLNDSFVTFSGNSAAVPQVSGLAALIMAKNNLLKTRPESVKAIIMASALHNVDGNSPVVSDKDGVGGIDAAIADQIVQNAWWVFDVHPPTTNNKTYSISVGAGEKVRAVLFWSSHTSSGPPYTSDVLSSNLDLYVTDPNNTSIAASIRMVDNFEIVEFTAYTTGTYNLEVIRGPSASNDTETFGLAWSRTATYLPDIRFNTSDGWDSTIYIRNDDAQTQYVTVQHFNENGTPAAFGVLVEDLAPNEVWELSPNGVTGWRGSAVVDGSEDLSVIVTNARNTITNSERTTYSGIGPVLGTGSPGWEKVSPTLYAPTIKRSFGNRSSTIYVVNAGTQATTIQTNFYDDVGAVRNGGSLTLDPNQRAAISASSGSGSSGGCAASGTLCTAVITSNNNQLLAGVVNEQNNTGTSAAITHNVFRLGTKTIYFPVVKHKYFNNSTGIRVQNITANYSQVTVTFYNQDGTTKCSLTSTTLPPRGATTYSTNDTCPGSGFLGSAVVKGDYEIVGMTNEASLDGRYKKDYSSFHAGSRVAYGPLVYRSYQESGYSYSWNSGIGIRNISSQPVHIILYYYNTSGNIVATDHLPVIEGGGMRAYIPNITPFKGSVVVTSDQDIVVMVNTTNTATNGDSHASYNAPSR